MITMNSTILKKNSLVLVCLLSFFFHLQAQDLHKAARTGDLDVIITSAAATDNINERDYLGLTAWQTANMFGYGQIADKLAEVGADTSLTWPSPDSMAIRRVRKLMGEKPEHGVSYLISRDGKIIHQQAYGLASPGQSLTTQHVFRIGSVTKQFTAAGILKLIESGKLSLDDKLSQFFPSFSKADEVTIYHLLTHTSGIHSYTSDPDFTEVVVDKISLDEKGGLNRLSFELEIVG